MAEEPVPVRISDNRQQKRYEAYVDDVLAASVTYELTPGGITFVHTQTDPTYQGRGIAGRLARAALDDAASRGLRVTPRCPFIAGYIETHPAYAHLVGPPP